MLRIQFNDDRSFGAINKKDLLILLGIGSVMLVCQFFADGAGHILALRGDSVVKIEVWRFFSAYFIHANWQHLAINFASLIAALCLFPEMFRRRVFLPVLFFNALLLSIVLSFYLPANDSYYGFSALLYAFLATSAVYLAKRNFFAFWVLGFLAIKITWEQIYGPMQSSEALVGGKVATGSHLIGALVGIALGLLWRYLWVHDKRETKR